MQGFHCTDYMSISKSQRRSIKRCMVAYLFQKVSYTRMKLENAQEYFFHHCGQVEFILEKRECMHEYLSLRTATEAYEERN